MTAANKTKEKQENQELVRDPNMIYIMIEKVSDIYQKDMPDTIKVALTTHQAKNLLELIKMKFQTTEWYFAKTLPTEVNTALIKRDGNVILGNSNIEMETATEFNAKVRSGNYIVKR